MDAPRVELASASFLMLGNSLPSCSHLYFMSDMLIEKCVIQFDVIDNTNVPEVLFSYEKMFNKQAFGFNIGTFAKIKEKWRFYPIFQMEIKNSDVIITDRMQGKFR